MAADRKATPKRRNANEKTVNSMKKSPRVNDNNNNSDYLAETPKSTSNRRKSQGASNKSSKSSTKFNKTTTSGPPKVEISNNGSKLNPVTQIRWLIEATIDFIRLFIETRSAKINFGFRLLSFYLANYIMSNGLIVSSETGSSDSISNILDTATSTSYEYVQSISNTVLDTASGIINFEDVIGGPDSFLYDAIHSLSYQISESYYSNMTMLSELSLPLSSDSELFSYYNLYLFLLAFFIHTAIIILFDVLKYAEMMVFAGKNHTCIFNIFNDEEMTQHCYARLKWTIPDSHSQGVDLGFLFYNGDYTKDRWVAQREKFEYTFNLMGLKPGMRVMDVGCGMGDWLVWLKNEKNCSVRGVNMTSAQAMTVIERGIKCDISTFQDLQWRTYPEISDKFWNECYQNFDAVTFWDNAEHFCSPTDLFNKEKRKEVFSTMFDMSRDLIDPNSECQTVWASTLHISRRLCRFGHFYDQGPAFGFSSGLMGMIKFYCTAVKEWVNCYIMSSLYNGQYPGISKDYSMAVSIYSKDYSMAIHSESSGFRLVHRENRIEDYRMTSILNKNHFGNYVPNYGSLGLVAAEFFSFFFSPHWFMYQFDGHRLDDTAWMWHVGGTDPKERHWLCPTHLFWDVYCLRDKKEKDLNPLHKKTLPTHLYCDNTTLPTETSYENLDNMDVDNDYPTLLKGKSPKRGSYSSSGGKKLK